MEPNKDQNKPVKQRASKKAQAPNPVDQAMIQQAPAQPIQIQPVAQQPVVIAKPKKQSKKAIEEIKQPVAVVESEQKQAKTVQKKKQPAVALAPPQQPVAPPQPVMQPVMISIPPVGEPIKNKAKRAQSKEEEKKKDPAVKQRKQSPQPKVKQVPQAPKQKKIPAPKKPKIEKEVMKMEEIKEEVKIQAIPQMNHVADSPQILQPQLLKKKSSGPRQVVLYKVGDCLLVQDQQDPDEMKNEEDKEGDDGIDEARIWVLQVTKQFIQPPKKANGNAIPQIFGLKFVATPNQAPRSRISIYTLDEQSKGDISITQDQIIGTLIPQPKKQKKNERPQLFFTKSEVDRQFKNVQNKDEVDINDFKIRKPKAPKRQKLDEAGNIIEGGNEEEKKAPINKRQKKAAAKKQEKEVVLPREDVQIPESIEVFDSEDPELLPFCCQTCANRNVNRAAKIGSHHLFMICLKKRAQVSSLFERLAPETTCSAIETAIKLNRVDILETLLSQDKDESDYRGLKHATQVAKFDTGEMGEMAFGFKARKVNMMRGNRQGNNAFLEDLNNEHKTPCEYLVKSVACRWEAFGKGTVLKDTLLTIQKCLGADSFKEFVDKSLAEVLIKSGNLKTLESLFEIFDIEGDLVESIFNKVFFELLFHDGSEALPFTFTAEELDEAKKNKKANFAHIGALNPSGAALQFLVDNEHQINQTFGQTSTAHYAAVCQSTANLQIIKDKGIPLFAVDKSNRTPLMWAIQSLKKIENAQFLMENYSKGQNDAKDASKDMAIHYLARHGVAKGQDSDAWIKLFVQQKAKFSQAAGFDKYTPLILAATKGNFRIVEDLINNVPRLNLDKGDKFKRSPILMACRNGHSNIVALLLKHHADPGIPDSSMNQPLHHAAAYGWLDCVRTLMAYKTEEVSPSAENSWKVTPITIALQKNHSLIVKELLQTEEINVNAKDDDGRTLLSLAVGNINADSVDLIHSLLSQKIPADVNTQDAKGQTPLYHVVQGMVQRRKGIAGSLFGFDEVSKAEMKIVELLLENGAEMGIKAKDEKSPFSLAFEGGLNELLSKFWDKIDLNKDPTLFFSFSNISVLREVSHQLLYDCMKEVAVEEESINFVNDQGFTPFLWYIHQALLSKNNVLNAIQDLVQSKKEELTNKLILDHAESKKYVGIMIHTPKVLGIFKEKIVDPFINFLQMLIQKGANIHAYVLKLKQYREEVIQSVSLGMSQSQSQFSLPQKTMNTNAVIQAAALARRPPEKDQYLNENLGLCNALHLLIDTPITEIFQFLVSQQGVETGSLLNQVNVQKMSPFFKLVRQKDFKIGDYKMLFDSLLATKQVEIDSPDQFGASAFWYLYSNNRLDDALYLVQKFAANINHIDNYGMFGLKKELFGNNFQGFQRLLDQGHANPNMKDEFQRTVLHLCCDYSNRRDYNEYFKILMRHNANIAELDFKGRTPLHYMYVKKNRRHECDYFDPLRTEQCRLELLLNAQTKESFDINLQDVNGKSLIHYAAQRGSYGSLELFVKIYGAKNIRINQQDRFGNTPLAIAIECRHVQFVEKLFMFFDNLDMKGFLYHENRQPKRRQQNNLMGGGGGMFGGGGAMQDDEQSDLEFMDAQLQLAGGAAPLQNDSAVGLFRYILKNNLAQLEQLFIKSGYDQVQMIVDYICEGQIVKLFNIIDSKKDGSSGTQESNVVMQTNDKGQNLIHVLAKNAHLMNDVNEIIKFYKQLQDRGLRADALDDKGRTALHHAIRSQNLAFIKFLIEVEHFDVNQTDSFGRNTLNYLVKGDRILAANQEILKYLISKQVNLNQSYKEGAYGNKDYLTTSVIHSIRHQSKDRDNIKIVLKELLDRGADPTIQDSQGRDAFMYTVIRNHTNTFEFMLSCLKEHGEEQKNDQIIQAAGAQFKRDSQDRKGKSLIHYIVEPLEFGSYENSEILQAAIDAGFKPNLRDTEGNTPYQLALKQKSGILAAILKEHSDDNFKGEEMKVEEKEMMIQQVMNNDKPDFEADAHNYLNEIQMQIDPHKYVPCDPSGKFSDDCAVIFDDGSYEAVEEDEEMKESEAAEIPLKGTQQHFDVYLTRVQIGKFQPGGDYIFYRMQLVMDKSRDLPILFTRWGRIGEEGAFQKTPFNTLQEAVNEFKSVFEQKTGCKWCHKDKFQKKFGKFQLMRSNYVTIDQQNFLLPFTHEQVSLPCSLQKSTIEVLHQICDVNTYLKALKASGVDPKAMPFSQLNRKNLYDALDVLESLEKTLKKLETMNPRPYAEAEKMKLLQQREKMWYLSSRFYEFIPHEEFRNKMVPPISNLDMLVQKSAMLQQLIQIEMASKILLGALLQTQVSEINPLEYCVKAIGLQLVNLESQSAEFKLIKEYVDNTYTDLVQNNNQHRFRLTSILKLEQDSSKPFRSDLENRQLLFHGSRTPNFLGILAQGLRVSPIEVQRNGNLLGKGIYFTDMIMKAIQYTGDANRQGGGSRFVMVCEVALGNTKEFMRADNGFEFTEGINSVVGAGRQAPDDSNINIVTLPDGAKVNIGKVKTYQKRDRSQFEYNEFVVPDPAQVRLRYLLEFK